MNKALLSFMLSLGATAPAMAGDMSCTGRSENNGDDFNYANDFDFGDGDQLNDIGVIDGNDPYTMSLISTVSTLAIDGDCTIKNFTKDNPFPVKNINYWTPNQGTKPSYLIVFDNVYYTGGMSCSNIPHKLWLSNGTEFAISSTCQDYFIPVEKIDKLVPGPLASIGVPFTYTLNIPVMYDPVTQTVFNSLGSPNDLGNIHVTDDLTAAATVVPGVPNSGAEMSLVGDIRAYYRDNPAGAWVVTNNGDNKHLDFLLPDVAAGSQIIVEIPVVLDAGNTPGWQFRNTAQWEFSRFIAMDANGDGVIDPGEGRFFDPLPGDNGVSPAMTIAEPNLVVTKSTPATAVNPANTVTYTIDVQNTGGWEAWNVRLEDLIPQNTVPASAPAKGMCETDPTTFGTGLSAQILNVDGTLNRTLAGGGTDYTLAWSTTGPDACKIILTLTDNGGAIGPNQHLVVTYQTALDSAFSSGGAGDLINVAGATQWFNAGSTVGGRIQYLGGGTGVLTDGTPGVPDFQDNASVTAAVSGYYFEKTVSNLATGDNPATGAAPGDTLRYRLHLFNVDQTISDISIADPLDPLSFVLPPNIAFCDVVGPVTAPVNPVCSFDTVTKTLQVAGSGGAPLDLPQGDDLVIEFEVTLQAGLGNGAVVSNQAQLTATGITSDPGPIYYSDDPNFNGVASPDVPGDEDPTDITIVTPGALTKANPANTNVAIGQQFSYQITVPATAVPMPLYDVRILDTLPANLRFVSASAAVGATTLTLTDTDGGADNNLVLLEQATGLDIPANEQAIVTLTVAVDNDAINQAGVTFTNTASYTYSRTNGSAAPQLSGGAGTTPTPMTVVEPAVTIVSKDVSFISPASKVPGTDPATVGDVLQYVVTIDNTSADATAYDVNVVDTLPPELALYSGFTPTATMNGSPVGTFVATPADAPAGPLIWGADNGDGSLDIPAGGQLVLTYQVTVLSATAPTIVNSVAADWTSQDGAVAGERTGVTCPNAPDDYCAGPVASLTIPTQDNTAIAKVRVTDDYEPTAGTDPIVRVGDTVTYELTLSLQEYLTRSVVVEDQLPQGMALESVTITAGASGDFSYTLPLAEEPTVPSAAGALLRWNFGDITNTPNGSPLDQLVIQYVARVVTDAAPTGVDTTTSIPRTNQAQLTYTGYAPANPDLTATETIEVRQPQMRAITKVDLGTGRVGTGTAADPYQVDIANDQMIFQLSSCNDGLAPAYGVVITDQLSQWLDETDLAAAPLVKIGTATLNAGTDFLYTAPARGGLMQIALQDSAPVDPGECVTVDYTLGFHTDLTIQTSWNNEARLTEYRSLPLSQPGRLYDASATFAQVWMSNVVNVTPLPLTKTLTTATEVTVGEEVIYQVTLPAMNVARDNVVVTDTLHGALAYVSDMVSLNGAPLGIAPVQSGQTLTWTLGTIPAGQSAEIMLTTRVANNDQANAGVSFSNIADYTYTDKPATPITSATSDAVKIVEPAVNIGKTVANISNPGAAPNAGDTLRYSITVTAGGGVAGDNFSDAFDLSIFDNLSLGLAYQSGTASVDGTGNTIFDPTVTGDGNTTAQTLSWNLAETTADIDVVEGTVVTVTYDVLVLDSVLAGQQLTNSATVQWTGLDGINGDERDGSGTPLENDYVSGPATAPPLTVLDNTTFAKTRLSDSWGAADANVRIGDVIDYELRIHLDEGSHSGLTLSDVLPKGLAFEQVVNINGETAAPYIPVLPFDHTPINNPTISGDAATGPTTVTWTLGNVVNTGDNNSANDEFVIVYRARVLNRDVFTQANTTPLTNTATLNYNTASGAASRSDTESVTLLQPNLTVSKLAAPAGGDSAISAGEQITYTVDVLNTGAAPAYDAVVEDILPVGLRQGGVNTTSITLVSAGTTLPMSTPSYDAATGTAIWDLDDGTADTYQIPAGETLRIVYTVQADADLGPGLTLSNAVTATDYYSLADGGEPGACSPTCVRENYGPSNTATTDLSTPLPGAPLKENPASPPTIGQEFTYTITVPAEPLPTALHDVRILDNLAALPVDVTVVSIDKLSGSQTWTPVNTNVGSNNLVIADTASGIEIPANEQIKIGITLRLDNTVNNDAGDSLVNSASYTYNQVDGDVSSEQTGGSSTTTALIVVEPVLSVTKVATPLSTPITGGSLIQYTVTVDNSGGAMAREVNVVDTLPPELALYSGFIPTATINGSSVAGFIATPAGAPGGPLVWGRGNGDNSLDVPANNGQLVITYQAQVQVSTAATIENTAWVDWTSLDGDSSDERTGAGCPTVTAPNDYCAGPATASITITDSNSLAKSVVADSYVDAPSTATDATVRIGDTVTYRLALNLAEGTTSGVTVTDALPAGMAFDSLVGIIQSTGGNFSYTLASQPAAGDTTPVWDFGDISNTPSGDGTAVDTLIIEYKATVLPDAGIAHTPSSTLTNTATLSYLDGSGSAVVDPARLQSQASITLWQPLMDNLSKTDRLGRVGTSATPFNVSVTTDTMQFRLQSCNTTGLAPAYGVVLTDVLASQLDETSITGLTVMANGAPADYVYTPPGVRGGILSVQLTTPVNPGQCVTVDYDIGFHTDFGPNQTWNNSVTLSEYWSLPAQSGQQYAPIGPAAFFMTNQVTVAPPVAKTLVSLASEVTIGDEVVYQILVPSTPVNAALDNVVVTDALHAALEYVSATAVDNSGTAVALTDNSVAPGNVNLTIAQIPAGDQVTITLTARVANNDQANAGASITNSASYSYTGMPAGIDTTGSSGAVTIIEPAVILGKIVENLTNPGAAPNPGDVLRYSLTLTASGGVAGDNFSKAFDILIGDSMSLGLAYQNGTATVDGTGNTITDPTVTGDGVTTAQTLTWSLADATADIDVAEGGTVTVTYDVLVLSSALPGQDLTNSATLQWTGQDGINAFERTGANDVPVNDYFTGPTTTTVMTELAVSFVKSVVNATTGENPGANASPGDTLHYTLVVTNQSLAPVTNASLVDELAAEFAAGTLQLISVSDPTADSSNTSATGGANGTGIVDIRNFNLAAQGNPGDTLTIEFEATLLAVIDSGTTVLNHAQLSGDNLTSATSNETTTLIGSAPAFEVWKSSQDLTGDTNVLMAGDTLRYTITVQNIGNENAINSVLQDQIPQNTTYVANSTTLNGTAVADPSTGVSPLQNGMLIQSPVDTTAGAMLADATTMANVATITFDVVVNSTVVGGTQITNQARVNANGAGASGTAQEVLSDDPGTVDIIADPTVDVVGNLPSIDAHKTVIISTDNGSPGSVDPNDVLTYTIVVYNNGAVPSTGVTLTDTVPQYTSYVANSTRLNGIAVADPSANVSALQNGMLVTSSGSPSGTIDAGASAIVTFQVQVDATVPVGTVPPTEISNQGVVSSNEQNPELTDNDGIDSNGDLPTVVVVGDAQLLSITKEVFDINGGLTEAGDELDYVITVQNIGSVTATDVQITDTLPAGVQYLPGFTSMNGSANGVTFSGGTLTADYANTYGNLPVGGTVTLRFRVVIDALPIGTSVTNTGVIEWNGASQSDSATAIFTVGGIPGAALLSGRVWHDLNNDQLFNGAEQPLAGWSVEIYRNTTLLGTVVTDANGFYQINGLAANDTTTDAYALQFVAPGSGSNTAALGLADSIFTNGLQTITQITVSADSVNQNLNLPIMPNGVVYDAIARTPIVGAVVTMLDAASQQPLPATCFDDAAQQNQVTLASGYYRFDLNFSDAACTSGGEYFIQVSHSSTNYEQRISLYIPPQSDLNSPAFSVPTCLGSTDDAVPATADLCEVVALATAPPASVVAGSPGTSYHLHLLLSNTQVPGTSQLFNNHIPLDPVLEAAVAITKTAGRVSVSRSEMVPYTITVNNSYLTTLQDLRIVDTFPAGFKYVKGSARFDGQPLEPTVIGNQLHWENVDLATDAQHTIQLLFIVGAGVSEGDYINRAHVVHVITGDNVSGEASATVRVVPDPTFDCTDVTGKVFDDRNLNGYQDEGEAGLPGARLATARGLIVTADEHGRFHITCAVVPNEDRGSNFVLKLDDRSLPSGYRVTSENPRVQRATRGKMMKFNFGATIHRVVRMDVADGVFERDSANMRPQWLPRINLLLSEMQKAPAVLRLSYLADVEDEGLVMDRVKAVKAQIADAWDELNCCYKLTIETEVYWRRGAPPARSGVID